MSATTPAPTVRPPSRMAKRRPFSMAIGRDQVDLHRHVVARHHHLRALGQLDRAGHVRGPEVELRPVVGEERRVPPALLLGQDVDLALELGVRRDRARLAQDLAALDIVALGAAQQDADIVARLALVQQLPEHLHPGAGGLDRGLDAHDLDLLAHLDDPALDPARSPPCRGPRSRTRPRSASGTAGRPPAPAAGCSCPPPPSGPGSAPGPTASSRPSSAASAEPLTIGMSSPGKPYLVSSSRTSSSTSSKQLLVVDHVDLVQVDHDRRHAHLARQQDVLARLRHRPVRRRDHQDRTVHLRRTGDHVLHVVGVARAVDMRVVPVAGLVLDVRGVDRDPARLLLRRLVDLVVGRETAPRPSPPAPW